MIGRLRGIVSAESPDGELVMDVNGVGYELRVPLGTMGRARAEENGSHVLYVHTAYKQDGVELYGFASLSERTIFRSLISVPNVGPKTAVTILGSVPIGELARVIEAGDAGRLSKIPGIGKKTAERMIVELKGKLMAVAEESTPQGIHRPSRPGQTDRLVTALTNMGYRLVEATRAVESLGDSLDQLSLAEALREALAQLTRR